LSSLRTNGQNYISVTTIRDVSVLRNDLLSALASAGLVQAGQPVSAPELNAHAGEQSLLKALLLAALYPRVARVSLPRHAVKFARVAGGAVERDAGAREWRATDMRGARVWVHPASVQFAETRWHSGGIVVSFERVETSTKVFLRDVTEVYYTIPPFRLELEVQNICLFLLSVTRPGPAVRAAFVRRAHRRRSRPWRVDRRRPSRRDVARARMAPHRDPRPTTPVGFFLPLFPSHLLPFSSAFPIGNLSKYHYVAWYCFPADGCWMRHFCAHSIVGAFSMWPKVR
jgi:hypothetical protein